MITPHEEELIAKLRFEFVEPLVDALVVIATKLHELQSTQSEALKFQRRAERGSAHRQ